MARAKRGVKSRRRHNRVLKLAKGYIQGRRRLFRQALETIERGWKYAFRDRRAHKRSMRNLWIARINAGARQEGISYSRLVFALKKAKIGIDRKILADLALHDGKAFAKIVAAAKSA